MSHEQVRRGMLGALVVAPKPSKAGKAAGKVTGVTALVHLSGGVRTVNGQEGDVKVNAPAGQKAR